MRNLVTDVPGLRVGQAHDVRIASGVTVMLFDRPAVAAVSVPGGAAAGRDLACLALGSTVERIDGIVLSGGSGFGLDAATGAQAWLREQGRGLPVGPVRVPIVPSAILFDLLNGGDKEWGRYPPYRELAYAACGHAGMDFALGTAGAGYGATTVDLKGGIGSASAITAAGFRVGALVAVNAIGSAVVGGGPHFWAAPYEQAEEFGGLGSYKDLDGSADVRWKGGLQPATTLVVVATDAVLDRSQAARLALMASGGLAKSLRVTFAPADGDTVFVAATCLRPLNSPVNDLTEIGSAASDCVARALARGIYEATALPSLPALPAWKDRHVRTLSVVPQAAVET